MYGQIILSAKTTWMLNCSRNNCKSWSYKLFSFLSCFLFRHSFFSFFFGRYR